VISKYTNNAARAGRAAASTETRESPSMKVVSSICRVRTLDTHDLVDVTEGVEQAVAAAGVSAGRVTVTVPSPTCAVVVNERETGLLADIGATLDRMTARDNGASPVSVGSRSAVLPVVGGRVHLGMWQRLLLVELEGPGERSLTVQVVGD
jgi:secondary thiamine-phosphate synthase enzyme